MGTQIWDWICAHSSSASTWPIAPTATDCVRADWQLHEEVAIAAFTCGQPEVGRPILQKLQKKFKESNRVECLRGMAYESIGELDEAELIYDKIIATKPSFPDALKRKVRSDIPSSLRLSESIPLKAVSVQSWYFWNLL